MHRSTRRTLAAALLTGAALLAAAAPAAAAEPVTIRAHVDFGTGIEDFRADGGGLCPVGSVTSDGDTSGGRHTGVFHVIKVFECDDLSGSFTILLQARLHWGAPSNKGAWTIVDGTGRYEDLHGGGQIVGTYDENDPNVVDDLYTGRVTNP